MKTSWESNPCPLPPTGMAAHGLPLFCDSDPRDFAQIPKLQPRQSCSTRTTKRSLRCPIARRLALCKRENPWGKWGESMQWPGVAGDSRPAGCCAKGASAAEQPGILGHCGGGDNGGKPLDRAGRATPHGGWRHQHACHRLWSAANNFQCHISTCRGELRGNWAFEP
jgi:hypothetical protein